MRSCSKYVIAGLWSPGVSCGDHENPEVSDPSHNVQSDIAWKQKLPDAIEDQEIRSTVASVLEGAEDVLSVFFTNPSSTLRKVKADRVKRKQMAPAGESISAEIGISDPTVHTDQNIVHLETEGLSPPPPLRAGDVGITQWSPLSLSEIPLSTGDTHDHNISVKEEGHNSEELQHHFDCVEQVKPVNTGHTGLTKKKRKFIYTVETPKCKSVEDTQSQKVESLPVIQQGVNMTVNARKQMSGSNLKGSDTKSKADLSEEIHPSIKAKLQDLDISQLSKDFAQDFSQIPELSLDKDTSRNVFSPSACLSALKRANKERQAHSFHECDVSNKPVIASNQNSVINESTISDSGFHSAVGNGIHVTVSSVCETDIHKTASHEVTGTNPLSQSISPVTNEKCISARGPVKWKSPFEKDQAIKEKTYPPLVVSGFKTASNKGIHVLSANLERAQQVFEETLGDPNNKGICDSKEELGLSHNLLKSTTCIPNQTLSLSGKNVENSTYLTASQKADMTELCMLLEEAESQFEFPQLPTAQTKQPCQEHTPSPEKPDKDLDPDFLTGIDFDDSFNTDAEKHLTQDKKSEVSFKISNVTHEATSLSSDGVTVGKSSPDDVTRTYQGTSSVVSTEQHVLDSENNLLLGVGFKTAGGNMKVSKQCLSKAKDLFADLEPHFLSGTSQSKQSMKTLSKPNLNVRTGSHAWLLNFNEEPSNSMTLNRQGPGDGDGTKHNNVHAIVCQKGFQLASGKVISVSEEALQDAAAFFRDCSSVDSISDTCVRHKESVQPVTGNDKHQTNFQKCENAQGFKLKCPKRKISMFETSPTRGHADLENGNNGTSSSPAKPVSAPFPCAASNHIGSSSLSITNPGTGFCKASGDKIVVSAKALQKAHCLFSDMNTFEDTNQLVASQKLVSPLEKISFQTASGQGVSISNAALRKTKALLQDCGENEGEIGKEELHSKIPIADPPARSSGFRTASGKAATCSSEALQKAKALFSDISCSFESVQANRDDQKGDNTENKQKIHCGFSTAGGAKVHISQKSILKAKNLFRDFDSVSATENQEPEYSFKGCDIVDDQSDISVKQRETLSSASGFDKVNRSSVYTSVPPTGSGFHTASGKKVSVSNEAMMKAKSFLNESVAMEGIKEELKPKFDTFPAQSGGFQTASGKGVTISSAALQKAKTLFSESEHVKDEPDYPKMPFHAGIGKKMTFSPKTPQKTKADNLTVAFANNGEHEDSLKNNEVVHCGFTTAGGAKVHVSQKSLLKAKSLLNDIDDGQTPFSSSTSKHDTEDLLKSTKLPTASNNNVPRGVKSSNSLLVNNQKRGNTQSVLDPSSIGSVAEMSRTKRTELSNVTKTDESSFLCFQSFDINDCSETQKRFLAQEALDCTKALLEDECLFVNDDPQLTDRPADDRKRKGKRLVEDPNMTGKGLHR